MDAIILEDIPFTLPMDRLMARLHVRPGSASARELEALVDEALAIGRPRALFGMASVEHHGEDHVVVDGVTFTSRLVAVNLRERHRVFPYLATCGAELGEWAHGLRDIVHQYWAEEIKIAALANATQALQEALLQRYQPGKTAAMNPGSLPDWPLREQGPMFALLGQAQRVGVTLNESFLMTPNKSVTGLRFSSDSNYENCRLCPRPDCPGRRAPYDPTLWQRQYAA